jgi:hypothetical protein
VAEGVDGTRHVLEKARYIVDSERQFPQPKYITLDEARFLGFIALGLSQTQAKSITAMVEMTQGWGNSGYEVVAGFVLSHSEHPDEMEYGVMVSQGGRVNFLHGLSAARTLELANAEPVY